MSVAFAQTPTLPNRDFALEQGAVTQDEWNRLIHSGEHKYGLSAADVERALDMAIAMLRLVKADPDGDYMPSDLADTGRHLLLHYTRIDQRLCTVIADGFVHHDPHDEADVSYESKLDGAARTLAAMQDFNIPVDGDSWHRKVISKGVESFGACSCSSSGGGGNH